MRNFGQARKQVPGRVGSDWGPRIDGSAVGASALTEIGMPALSSRYRAMSHPKLPMSGMRVQFEQFEPEGLLGFGRSQTLTPMPSHPKTLEP